ncbi:Sister chromatid cohesion protein 2 [Teratosphaeriaceae sp. CCFEE 6253]|nr:Sister chromatid cohesion protein 2 [Teratosphaeriaceae sp. CCFEE 6253]
MIGRQQPNGQDGRSDNGIPTSIRPAGGLRVPTVHEALPFTPFTSIVSFNPASTIPPPLALPTPTPSYFAETPEVVNARRTLDHLSAGAISADQASQRCQQTLRDVQKLLDSDSLTQYKFKKVPRPNLANTNGKTESQNSQREPQLSSFARMVFDNTDISYRYLTPDSPGLRNGTQSRVHERAPIIKLPTPQSRVKPEQPGPGSYATPPTDQPPSGSQGSRLQAVVVPSSLTPAQRAEYQYISEADTTTGANNATPSRSNGGAYVNTSLSVSADQQQKGDHAVASLQALLSTVLHAEDVMQSESSGDDRVHAQAVLAVKDTSDGLKLVLQPQAQAQLDTNVQKVVASGRLESLGVESLMHVQRLCEAAVSEVETLSLSIGEDWAEQDAQEWVQRLVFAESGITAARTLLRIMGGGAHIQELQSEDYLRTALAAIRSVLEGCVVPVVEDRASTHEKIRGSKEEPPANPSFALASEHRSTLQTLMHSTAKTLKVLGDFLTHAQLDETALSSIESFCTLLIFTENAGNERDSVLGIQSFETTRRCAMDVLAKDFARYTEQRQTILDQLLMSLDKLPAAKLPDSKPIQLVSALLMRLVQTSATHAGESTKGKSKPAEDEESDADAEGESSQEEGDDGALAVASRKEPHQQPGDLFSIVRPLHEAAQEHATYIIRVLLLRAGSSAKSGDEPYRRLLDIFTEDFLTVLPSSDWPSAEMLLRTLVSALVGMVDGARHTVPARTLALELLGTIGTGILELQITARKAASGLDADESDITRHLAGLIEQLRGDDIEVGPLTAFDGPYRMVVEYLQTRNLKDAQLRSAQGFHVMQWAFLVCGGREGSTESEASGTPRLSQDLHGKLRNMVSDMRWLENNHDYPAVSTSQGRLAAIVLTLSSKLCKALNRIFNILLTAMSSEQPRVQSRALKSILTLLEKDPTILERSAYVLNHILRCANDASSLVRDSALMLIADCVKLKPDLDKAVYLRVIERSRDAALNVRRRAIKFLKDLYLGNESVTMRNLIAEAVIARMEDNDPAIVDLAQVTMEEIWFIPFTGIKPGSDGAMEANLRFSAQASLLIHAVENSEDTGTVLESMIKHLISKSKTHLAHTTICAHLVRILSDGIVDSTGIAGSPGQGSILRCLAVFARACPRVFTSAQVERLEPYTKNLANQDDLEIYRSAVTILRHVMPYQSTFKAEFLKDLQTALLTSVPKLPKSELQVVVPCLWTIDSMLGNRERLVNYVISALKNVYGMRALDFAAQPHATSKASRLVVIVGNFGKACDFEDHLSAFKSHNEWYKGNTVAALIMEVLCPFTSPKQPVALRQAGLEAVSMICQASPRLLLRQDVVNAFKLVFEDRVPSLEEALLVGLDGFFSAGERSEGAGNAPGLGSGVASGNERLGKTYVATEQDGASTSIARRFLPQILHIALSSDLELSFIASRIVVSVNRQGLVHPKESAPALVALETSPNAAIANMAFIEHKAQHLKHETYFDKEYTPAVQQVFQYQRDVIGSTCGFLGQPPAAKMHLLWDVLKCGKAQVRKKFLTNLASKLDFDLTTLDTSNATPTHLGFVRFCLENLALFEYDRVDDLVTILTAMEKVFSATGTAVAQVIESEVLQLHVDAAGFESSANALSEPLRPASSPTILAPGRLKQLAAAAQICSSIWTTRTFIRDTWNMKKHLEKPKNAAKESNRAASRVNNASALLDQYLKSVADIMAADATDETQRAVCQSFIVLISVDNEVKVDSGEEESAELGNGYDTPSEGASRKSTSVPPSGGGRGRKRKSTSATATPRKKGRPSAARGKSGTAKRDRDQDGDWE